MSLLLINAPILYENAFLNPTSQMSCMEIRHKMHSDDNTVFYPIEPLGIYSIMAYCSSLAIECNVINCVLENHHSINESLDAIKLLKNKYNPYPLLIGLTGSNLVFNENLAIANYCKQLWPETKIIIGGDFASLNYCKILKTFDIIDFVCVGDGEVLTYQLITALKSKNDFTRIPGLSYRTSDGTIKYNTREYIDINTLPFPYRTNISTIVNQGFAVGIYTSRGCIHNCNFCATGTLSHQHEKNSNPHQLRDISKAVDEIEYLNRKYYTKNFYIVDDSFLENTKNSKKRTLQFSREILKRKLNISYMIDCRYDAIDLELFKILFKSGLRSIYVGIESGQQKQQQYQKTLPPKEEVIKKLRQVYSLGINVICGILTFHPYVTLSELLKTIELLEELPPQRKSLIAHKLMPVQGTPIYDQLKSNGILIEEQWPSVKYEFKYPYINEVYEFITKSLRQGKDIQLKEVKQYIYHYLNTILDKSVE